MIKIKVIIKTMKKLTNSDYWWCVFDVVLNKQANKLFSWREICELRRTNGKGRYTIKKARINFAGSLKAEENLREQQRCFVEGEYKWTAN